MKILLVITGLGVGGAERLVTALADRYSSLGHHVVVAYFHGDAELAPSEDRVRLVNLQMTPTPLGVLGAARRLRRLIVGFQPDVVNTHLVHANILTRILRLLTYMPRLVSSAHNTNEEGWLRIRAYQLTDRLADISTNVSEEAVEAFETQGALKSGRMLTVYNGIDSVSFVFNRASRARLRAELCLDETTPLLLAVGRLWEAKDYPNLLRAFSRLGVEFANSRLAIVGEGPLRDDLGRLANSLGVADRVFFLGIRHDVPDLMSACDLFVLSSAWEGFGLVVAEAMACERVVVATDCGGVREVVGDAGLLVEPENSRALAGAIEQGLSLSAVQRYELGAAARQRVVDRFSLDVTADRYLAVYRGEVSQSVAEGID